MKAFRSSFAFIALLLISRSTVHAQLLPFGAQFYQNEYLANPAMAGAKGGMRINLGYRSQWNTIPGAPKNGSATGDVYITESLGAGLNMSVDKTGLITRSKIMPTLAYHLPVSEESKFHFGLSLGLLKESINADDLVGSANDPEIQSFSDRGMQTDVDFGIGFTSGKVKIDGTLYNLKSTLKREKNGADYSVFYTSAEYKVPAFGLTLIPKVAFRKVQNFQNLLDAGAEVSPYGDKLKFAAIYHSNQSASLGFRFIYDTKYELMGMYTTPGKYFQGYTYGTFEVGIKLQFAVKRSDWWE